MFNENWSHYLPHPGIEVVNRDLIGVILPDCSSLLATIFEMLSHISIYQEKIDQNEHKMLFYKGIFAEKTYLNLKKVIEENNDENCCNSKLILIIMENGVMCSINDGHTFLII